MQGITAGILIIQPWDPGVGYPQHTTPLPLNIVIYHHVVSAGFRIGLTGDIQCVLCPTRNPEDIYLW